MVTLHDMFDLGEFEEMKSAGFVKVQRHPQFPSELAIANYTHKAQQNYHWNAVTEQCRGLIYNPGTLEVRARPFRKFYNHNESNADVITGQEEVIAFDKLDGSLGIAYPLPANGWAIATRGSFTSEQALWATEFMHRKGVEYFPFIETHTDLFEIIYPDNRIVVEYGGMEELIYLGSVHIDTGRFEFDIDSYDNRKTRAEIIYTGKMEGIYSLPDRKGKEGLVVTTRDGRRVKVKQEEYVRLHRIVSNLSEKYVWEAMMGPYKQAIEGIVRDIPEEHAAWVRSVGEDLIWQYVMWHTKVSEVYHRVHTLETRKEIALAIKDEPKVIQSCIFKGLDNRPYTDVIWQYIKPKGETNNDD